MAEYFKNKEEEVPILALGEINNNYPFILVEIIDFYTNFKVRFSDYDSNTVIFKYFELKKITKKPLLIINCELINLFEDKTIHKEIVKFCNNDTKIIKL